MSEDHQQAGRQRTHAAEAASGSLPSLDATDRQLLWLLDLDPIAPLSRLAEELGLSARTVKRRLDRLTSGGVVRILGRTLPSFGGQLPWLVRTRGHPAAIGEVAAHLRQQPHARWVRMTTEGVELISGLVTAPGGRDSTFDTILRHPGLHDIQTYQLLEVWGPAPQTVTAAGCDLDGIDRRIMELLEADGRMDSSTLAATLNLDRSTVSRRRRRLLDNGIIYFEADIHPRALSESRDIFCWLQVRPGSIRAVAQQLRSRREVRFAAATTGTTNLAVHVVLPAGMSVVDFADEVFADEAISGVEIQCMGPVFKRSA